MLPDEDSHSSSKVLTSIQKEFAIHGDGSLRNSYGQCFFVWKVVDFQRWWLSFEAHAGIPLGRKLMNAATDEEEYQLNQCSLLETGWFMKKRRIHSALFNRWQNMGWGQYVMNSDTVFSHLLAPVVSGFALAANEGSTFQRKKIQWRQISNVQIQLETNDDVRSISLAPPPPQFPWDSDASASAIQRSVELDFQLVEYGWTSSGERSFFLPSGLFQRLFKSVQMQGLVLRPDIVDKWEFKGIPGPESTTPLILTALAVDEMISLSERPIYIQDLGSWEQLVNAYLKPFGYGSFINSSSLDEQGGVEFLLQPSPILPFTIGFLVAFWQRGIGRKARVSIDIGDEKCVCQITSFLSYSS